MTIKSKEGAGYATKQAAKKPGGVRRHRKSSPTKGWFSLEQRARFKGHKEQA